ncbi:hypothetical protein JR316_0012433 [Psilocybe cubensis]|uniref:Uncharacterized protein n=2 Tax=Psilocybe cubensis TaxID=181762 RepID=A0ACB8GIU7_PSICU|nr:hypothetical protein JR316_0012433 [Psilocybe cubensis]KAH9475322.1 hypothetical protein JR316_0012433 [Psilocybe cubensis]
MVATPESEINFCFPIPETLENNRILLTPFIASKHAKMVFEELVLYPELFRYLPFGPFPDFKGFDDFMQTRMCQDSNNCMFVIYDKTRSSEPSSHEPSQGTIAGLMGLINTSAPDLAIEIGAIMILPPFQRTHVTSNAVGLLLQYCLNLPSTEKPNALGLRRVFWCANSLNKPSVRTAERMGFTFEGIMRWHRVLPPGKPGNGEAVRTGDPRAACEGRDTAILSLCWDDWEGGQKEVVQSIMNRVA